MSSAAPNDEERGIPNPGNPPDNNNSANGGHDPRNDENEAEEELDDFIAPPSADACPRM